ncbi:8952_t:CDS:2, partial [Racocetra fulgida]
MSSTESTQIKPDSTASNIVESQPLTSIITNANTITSTSFQNRRHSDKYDQENYINNNESSYNEFDNLLDYIYSKKQKLDWKHEVEVYLKAPRAK